MTKAIMIQGTASSVGKSLIVAGLCRVFRQDGFSVAPFKSQNMALNSFVTRDGLEMGRAQAMQAEAAGVEPSAHMNPVLLKPSGDSVSQVIVHGRAVGVMDAAEYQRRKPTLIPAIRSSYEALARTSDLIVIEGAGSPAEINLAENDIVNMGMAAMADAPVLLVGDIDRGGVFASVYGTAALLRPEDRERLKGVVINKFRGDADILRPGLRQLEELVGVPVVGVVPWLSLDLDDEDSLSPRLAARAASAPVDVAVIRLPRLSNFTDFNALGRQPALGVRYVRNARELGRPDLVIIPGSKNTMGDLAWMREDGLEAEILRLARDGVPLMGICGGYQMLGESLSDPENAEGGGSLRGMGLLPARTVFESGKTLTRVAGRATRAEGFFSCLAGAEFAGYEIHMGRSRLAEGATPFAEVERDGLSTRDGAVSGNVLGTYVHGLFDSGSIAARLAGALLAAKGLDAPAADGADADQARHKERQYDLLAAALRGALAMDGIYRLLGF